MKRLAAIATLLGLAVAANFSGSLAIETQGIYSSRAGAFTMEAAYAGSLLASQYWGDVYLEAAIYPSWNLAGSRFDPGVSKLELGYGNGNYAIGLGAGPEPLATLRLLPPFSLADESDDYAPGLWGGWAELYPTPSTRLRLSLHYWQGGPLGIMQADCRLANVDYRLAFVYGPDSRISAWGTGFSTSLGETVVYGEAWRLLSNPDPWRGGLGASFYLYGGLASAEVAYNGGWQLAAAYSLPAGEYWAVDSLLLYEGGANRQTSSLSLTYLGDAGDVILGLTLTHDGLSGLTWLPSLSARVYY